MADNSSDPTTDQTQPSSFATGLVRLCVLCGLLGSLATLLSFAARHHWSLDLLVNMRSQLALGLAIVTLPLLAFRKWRHVLVFTICLLVNLVEVVPFYLAPAARPLSASSPARKGQTLTVLSGNVLSSNPDKQGYIKYLRQQNADLILLLEVDLDWARAARELSDEYPHQLVRPRGDNFGLALFSRYELVDARVDPLTSGLPTIIANVQLDDHQVTFIGSHPLPPIGTERFESRNTQIKALSTKVRESERPVILCGDLNTTPWSPSFKELLATSELCDARVGFGLQPTWPAKPWPFAIPIDHILISPEITATSFSVGPLLGSDHRAVKAELNIPYP
jgi:endonuclease/exonuclease/phosphatase (EEP) superfamily protein YafD